MATSILDTASRGTEFRAENAPKLTPERWLEQPITKITHAVGFRKVLLPISEPLRAFEMWVAVWRNTGHGEVFIGAPTLDALAARWFQITQQPLDRERVQHCAVAEYKPGPA